MPLALFEEPLRKAIESRDYRQFKGSGLSFRVNIEIAYAPVGLYDHRRLVMGSMQR